MSAKALGGLCLYGIIMTGSTAILAYLLTTSCGIDSEIKGSDNEGSCEVWEAYITSNDKIQEILALLALLALIALAGGLLADT